MPGGIRINLALVVGTIAMFDVIEPSGVQRRDHRLRLPVRPQRQIAQDARGTTVALNTYACAVAGGAHTLSTHPPVD